VEVEGPLWICCRHFGSWPFADIAEQPLSAAALTPNQSKFQNFAPVPLQTYFVIPDGAAGAASDKAGTISAAVCP
jgi:hypothetical protein